MEMKPRGYVRSTDSTTLAEISSDGGERDVLDIRTMSVAVGDQKLVDPAYSAGHNLFHRLRKTSHEEDLLKTMHTLARSRAGVHYRLQALTHWS